MSFAKLQGRAVEWTSHLTGSRNPPIERTGDPHKGGRRRPETLERLVLDMLLRADGPLTAHQLVACGKDDDFSLTPIQAYRVLGRLIARNAVQRIELLSAYLPIEGVQGGFAVCRCCSAATSVPTSALTEAIAGLCGELQFSTERTVVEIMGLCSTCQKDEAAYVKPPPARLPRARRTSNALKETAMKLKTFAGMAMLGVATLLSPPVDAGERKPDTLFGANGKPFGKITVTDAPKGVLLRIEAGAYRPVGMACISTRLPIATMPRSRGPGGGGMFIPSRLSFTVSRIRVPATDRSAK